MLRAQVVNLPRKGKGAAFEAPLAAKIIATGGARAGGGIFRGNVRKDGEIIPLLKGDIRKDGGISS